MSVIKRVPQVLEIDIVLAGVELGATLVEVPNPEGRLVLWRSTGFATIARTAPEEIEGPVALKATLGSYWHEFYINGGWINDGDYYNHGRPWAADELLIVTYPAVNSYEEPFSPDPAYVGKLYIEYWGADAAPQLERVRAGYRRQFAAFPRT